MERRKTYHEKKNSKVELQDDKILITISKDIEDQEIKDALEKAYNKYLFDIAKKEIPVIFNKMASIVNLYPKELKIRNFKRAWGNCSNKKIISINKNICKFINPSAPEPPFVRTFVLETDTETMKIITIVLAIDFFVEIGRAFNHMGEFGLNGVGDVYATTIISVSSCWLISVLLAYIFGVLLDMKLVGIWLAFAIDEIVRGMLYLIRWCSGRWKKKFIDKKI